MVKKKIQKKLRLKSKFVPKKNSIGFTTQQFDATEATTIGWCPWGYLPWNLDRKAVQTSLIFVEMPWWNLFVEMIFEL